MREARLSRYWPFCLCPLLPSTRGDCAPISEQDAQSIAVDAYLYFYPLVTMDMTRKQFTNIEPGKGVRRAHEYVRECTSVSACRYEAVVRPNFDTLYSIACLDLTKEPLVVSVPDTNGPLLSAADARYVDGRLRIAGLAHDRNPGGQFPRYAAGLERQRSRPVCTQIEAPTPYVWIIGRTKTDGPPDYDAVHEVQAGYKIPPLSQWGKAPKPIEVKIDPSVDMKTPPKIQVDTMPADKYFAYAADFEASTAAHHRSTDRRADETDRHRAGQEL